MENQHTGNGPEAFIKQQLENGATPQQVVSMLVSNGWQTEQAQQAVNNASSPPPPPPPPAQAAPANTTSQTGNEGTPLQVENVQYNMKMKPVRSRIGLFSRFVAIALWILSFFVGSSLVAIVGRFTDSSVDVAEGLVLTIALSVVLVPIFVVANKKLKAELAKNPNIVDDLFFKKSVRANLYAGVIIAGLLVFIAVFAFLSIFFLGDEGNAIEALHPLLFAGAFSSVIFYYWPLHAKTRR